ncbi:hypothetical protein [Polyangium sp. 6x1]|uniref:hypothetical protein n=1 Tax=Polyangium sp. 6x1 TaxID=3042689 RepID=UPI002482A315|nr:hypothetical protein [Polyangium sp. 6x1]MDI1449657.1 hypothetical protein [Polyangium sp. 6x1]
MKMTLDGAVPCSELGASAVGAHVDGLIGELLKGVARVGLGGSVKVRVAVEADTRKIERAKVDQAVTVDAGHMVYERRGEHEGAIGLREYPVEHFRSGAVVQLLGGCWEAGLDFVGVDGKVEVEGLDLERGACDFVLTWKARR